MNRFGKLIIPRNTLYLFVIRRATIKDLRRIYKLERVCFDNGFHKNQMESLLMNPNAFPIVFEFNKRIIGSLILYLDGDSAKVLTVAVHPSFRRRGIGTRLMHEAELIGRSLRQSSITLEVSTKNTSAIDLYASLGYQHRGLIESYYATGDNAYSMMKTIQR